jgi:hypothetical protein
MKKILKTQSFHWISLEQAKFSECVFQKNDYVVNLTNHEVQNIVTNSSILNDNQRVASKSESSHKQHATCNVIVICMWFFRLDENKLDEKNAFFWQLNDATKFFVLRMRATTKFSRIRKINFLRKRITKKKKNDIFIRVENDIINKKSIENVATMNDVFVSRSLKLRIAFLTLQENDQLV